MPFTALVYHRLSFDPAALLDPLTVRPAQLRVQLAWLKRRGYAGVSVSEALRAEQGGRPGRRVALTFDDGTVDFIETAWPLLHAHGFTATVAVPTSRIGLTADWDGPRGAELLSWDQLRALAAEGVEIAAHAHTHRALDTLPLAEAQADLAAAHAALRDQLGATHAFALVYPYGRANPMLIQAAASTGYAWAATARGGRNSAATHPHALRRTLLNGDDTLPRFALKVWLGYALLVEWRMDLRRLP